MIPIQSHGKNESIYFRCIPGVNDRGPTMAVETGPRGQQLFGTMPDFAALLLNRGNHIIIDEVLLNDISLGAYIKALGHRIVYFIGVFCDLEVMQEREFLRGDRAIGLSNDQLDRVHTDGKGAPRKYDLMVNTSRASPFSLAREILTFMERTRAPQSFTTMGQEDAGPDTLPGTRAGIP